MSGVYRARTLARQVGRPNTSRGLVAITPRPITPGLRPPSLTELPPPPAPGSPARGPPGCEEPRGRVQSAKPWSEASAQAAAGSGRQAVHGPPGAVDVHEGDRLVARGAAARLADGPRARGRPQGPGAQQAGQAEVVRGARAAAGAAAEAETHQLVGAVAQAERAHRHQLRAQAAAPRPRRPPAAPPARAAVPAPCSRRAAPPGWRGRGRGRLGHGPGRLGRRPPGSSAARAGRAAPCKETESRSGSRASPAPPRPLALSPTRQVTGGGRRARSGAEARGGTAGRGAQGGLGDAAQQGQSGQGWPQGRLRGDRSGASGRNRTPRSARGGGSSGRGWGGRDQREDGRLGGWGDLPEGLGWRIVGPLPQGAQGRDH